ETSRSSRSGKRPLRTGARWTLTHSTRASWSGVGTSDLMCSESLIGPPREHVKHADPAYTTTHPVIARRGGNSDGRDSPASEGPRRGYRAGTAWRPRGVSVRS